MLFFCKKFKCYFLSLHPEERRAKDLKDRRTNSLVGGLPKLLVKALANRLKKVMAKVFSDFHHAFVEGK